MTNQGIAIREPSEGLESIRDLEERFAIAVRQRELLERYITERLTPGKHFYKVQGSKNSLTKEGAELICLPHGYKPSYSFDAGPSQPPEDDTPYQLTVKCRLMKGESFAGEGIGSASSHITTKEEGRKPRQPDIGLRHNATLKMAQKSAYIAATLNATAASEFFTQDIEDGAEVAASKAAPKDNRFYCAEHRTNWQKHEKDGKVWYSHRQGTGWCNMKEVPIATQADLNDQATLAQDTPPAAQEATPAFANLGEFYTWARTIGYPTVKDRMDVPGIAEAIEAKDYTKAAELLLAAKEQAKKAG